MMKRLMFLGVGVCLMVWGLSGTASALPVPSGWTCTGNCGSLGADGVVTAPPSGSSTYQYVTTESGLSGVGALPSGTLGGETNGSTLTTSMFSANAGDALNFNFNCVTSDGAGFADYAWAGLFDSSNNLAALLFTARTLPTGDIVPGAGMPLPSATLTPSSVPIIGGGPAWSPLGSSSGSCFSSGCGYTGWINSSYNIGTTGSYYLQFGVVNWADTAFQSGLAVDGVKVAGVPITPPTGAVPEPASLLLLGAGFAGLVALRRRFQA